MHVPCSLARGTPRCTVAQGVGNIDDRTLAAVMEELVKFENKERIKVVRTPSQQHGTRTRWSWRPPRRQPRVGLPASVSVYTQLDLSQNKIKKLPDKMQRLHKLEVLVLDCNQVRGPAYVVTQLLAPVPTHALRCLLCPR